MMSREWAERFYNVQQYSTHNHSLNIVTEPQQEEMEHEMEMD